MQKILFTYWHQGFVEAPPIVKACTRTAEAYHPEWRIVQLDVKSVAAWIDPAPIPEHRWEQLGLAHRSDLIRTQLLIKYGGVWADPTVWFLKPLEDWLPAQMNAGLFLFRRPGRDRAISNWFMAADPGNRLLIRLYDKLCAYWSDNEFDNFDRPMRPSAQLFHRIVRRNTELPRLWLRKPIIRMLRSFPYMIYHYAFYDLVRQDIECMKIWEEMPEISADGPHKLLRSGLLAPANKIVEQSIDSRQHQLYKLTWKLSGKDIPEGSVLDYLIKSGLSDPTNSNS